MLDNSSVYVGPLCDLWCIKGSMPQGTLNTHRKLALCGVTKEHPINRETTHSVCRWLVSDLFSSHHSPRAFFRTSSNIPIAKRTPVKPSPPLFKTARKLDKENVYLNSTSFRSFFSPSKYVP